MFDRLLKKHNEKLEQIQMEMEPHLRYQIKCKIEHAIKKLPKDIKIDFSKTDYSYPTFSIELPHGEVFIFIYDKFGQLLLTIDSSGFEINSSEELDSDSYMDYYEDQEVGISNKRYEALEELMKVATALGEKQEFLEILFGFEGKKYKLEV